MFEYPKKRCIGCDSLKFIITKEHLFPKWLIERTKTYKTGIRWLNKRNVSPYNCTVPLCRSCNKDFGEKLEGPVSKIFDDIENHRGLSENEAELLIRWMWKMTGLSWVLNHPDDRYTEIFTVKQRVLRPIDEYPRKNIILAICLVNNAEAGHDDLPMGIDSVNQLDAIFASGVFSRIAVLVLLDYFEDLIPSNFLKIRLKERMDEISEAKIFYPKVGFPDGDVAIINMINLSRILSFEHDRFALELRKIKRKGNK